MSMWARLHHVRWAKKALKDVRGEVVDIGVGSKLLHNKIKQGSRGKKFIAIDKQHQPGVELDIVAKGEDLPLKGKSVDGVLILDVLEHVEDPMKFLKEARRVLKPGGVLHLVVPLEGVWWVMDWWVEKLMGRNWKGDTIGHIHRFSLRQIRKMLKEVQLDWQWARYSHHCWYQLGAMIYYWWLSRQMKRKSLRKMESPWWIQVGAKLFGWLTYVESWFLFCIPGGEVHITLRKKN